MLPSVGVFGGDSSAKVMISIFRKVGFVVSGVWANTREKAKTLAALMDIPFYTSRLDELLLHNDVDIVCVCGSPHQFAEVAVKSLSIGKHVFCCAPAGLNHKDAEKMVDAADYYPQLLSLLNHPLRFLKSIMKARDYIAEGYCGDLLVCECSLHTGNLVGSKYDWHCDQSMGGGILHSYGCHIIDIISFLANENACEAQGYLQTFVKHTEALPGFRQITSDDYCSFHLRYPSGMHANVTLNSHMPKQFSQEILIVGTRGFLRIVNDTLEGRSKDMNVSKDISFKSHNEPVNLNLVDVEYILPEIYLQSLVSLVEGIKSAFQSTQSVDRRNADHNQIAAAANFKDGCYVRAVMDAIMTSDRDGHWVKICSSPKNTEESQFWSPSEKKLGGTQDKIKTNQKVNSPNLSSSRDTPNMTRREKIR